MKHSSLILFAVFGIYLSHDILARTCYTCDKNDCTSDPANPVDCGDDYICVLTITTVFGFDSAYRPGICSRHCLENSTDYPEPFGCYISQRGSSAISETCNCNEDLCNAKEPDCSKRVLRSKTIREALAEKCKDEVEKYNLEHGEGENYLDSVYEM